MASLHKPSSAPSPHPSQEETVPLEEVVTGRPSQDSIASPHPSLDADNYANRFAGGYPKIYVNAQPTEGEDELRRRDDSARELQRQREVLKRLKAWHAWDVKRRINPFRFFWTLIGLPKRPACPSHEELLSLATFFFPPRKSLKVSICDFGEDYRCERHEVPLASIEHRECSDFTFGSQANVDDFGI
jgi:hypothetical protein